MAIPITVTVTSYNSSSGQATFSLSSISNDVRDGTIDVSNESMSETIEFTLAAGPGVPAVAWDGDPIWIAAGTSCPTQSGVPANEFTVSSTTSSTLTLTDINPANDATTTFSYLLRVDVGGTVCSDDPEIINRN
jgi:hypothetical protein